MRSEYLREAIALLERAQQTEDPREASELLKQATDIMALVAELSAPSIDPELGRLAESRLAVKTHGGPALCHLAAVLVPGSVQQPHHDNC